MEQQEMTTTQRLALFETAQETIGMMVARMSELIWNERRKPDPDLAQVEKWEAESKGYWNERRQLRYDDPASHRAALDKYGPIVRAFMKESSPSEMDREKLAA